MTALHPADAPASEPGHQHDHQQAHDHQHDAAAHDHTHAGEDHSHVGSGFVMLDIGDGYGAAVIVMPAALLGVEIETRRSGTQDVATHVMVLPRPMGDEQVPTLVFPSLPAGDYDLWRKPDGPVELTVTVPDSGVVEARWPVADSAA